MASTGYALSPGICLSTSHPLMLYYLSGFYMSGMIDNCVTILRQCKKAIAHMDGSSRTVIIIDIVIGSNPNDVMCKEAQVLCDLYIMGITNGGIEREEYQWRRIFIQAGFSDYKITPIHGIRSVIEVYL